MKTKIMSCLLLALGLMNTAMSTTTNYYQGKSEINLSFFKKSYRSCTQFPLLTLFDGCNVGRTAENAIVTPNFGMLLNKADNGRAIVQLSAESINSCSGFTLTMYAEEDGFGGFNVFKSKEDWTSGKIAGSIIELDRKLTFSFVEAFKISTATDRENQCLWDFGEHFNVTLNLTRK